MFFIITPVTIGPNVSPKFWIQVTIPNAVPISLGSHTTGMQGHIAAPKIEINAPKITNGMINQ